MDYQIIIIVLLVIILVIVLAGHILVVHVPSLQQYTLPTPIKPVIIQPHIKPMGGCAGTKYGCCPNSQIPKLNVIGSNCIYK